MAKVFVLDGNQRPSLAVVRSLGEKGVDITVGDCIYPNLSAASRYCKKFVLYPSPYENVKDFRIAVINELAREPYDVIIPMTDATIPIILKNRKEIEKYTTLPFVPYATYEFASNKFKLFKYAQEKGIPIPHTIFVAPGEEVPENLLHKLNYPVVIKPGKSRVVMDNKVVSAGISYAQSLSELAEKIYNNGLLRHVPFLIQEKIDGDGVGLFVLYEGGEPKILFSHRRLREKPPSGGVSVLCESIALDPLVKEYGLRILNNLKWHGVAMVEFKRSNTNGLPYLMEINARFWGSLQLAIDSGVDFPFELYRMAMGKRVTNDIPYKIGQRCKWLLGDLDHFYLLLKTGKYKEIKNSLLANWQMGASHFVLRKEDPAPFWVELKQYFKDNR